MIAPNLIDLLSNDQPSALLALRSRHPAEASVFSSDRLLGEQEAVPKFDPTRRSAILDLISTSVTTCAADFDAMARSIRETMKKVSRIRYVGSLIASISGGLAGVLAIALTNALIQAITAFLAMMGGIAAATAEQFERAPSGVRIASAEEYGKGCAQTSRLCVPNCSATKSCRLMTLRSGPCWRSLTSMPQT